MDKCSESLAVSLLRDAFPPKLIRAETLWAKESKHAWRIEDEIKISGIEGLTWIEITAPQARGTWDILEYVAPDCWPTLLPGYLKWLWNVEAADVMVSAISSLLIEKFHQKSHGFQLEQLECIGRFFSAALNHTRQLLSDEDAAGYLTAIGLVDALTVSGGNS